MTPDTPENRRSLDDAGGATEEAGVDGDGRGDETTDDDAPEYRIRFEGESCIGAGRCAEESENWRMDVETGKARPVEHFVYEDDVDHNLDAARVCPAKNGEGVIDVLDRDTGEPVEHD